MSKINGRPVRRTAVGVLASTLMLSGVVAAASPASAATGFSLDRIAGANRYETSAAIATAFGSTNSAILASGEAGRTVDALSANFLAGVQQAPVLLTTRTRIPASVRAVLNRLGGTKNVTIVGGTAAVGQMVEDELRSAGFTVTRLGGADRYATSEAIITAGRTSANPIGIVASGTSFPDALAGGPLAYKGKHPVILTSGGTLPQDSLDALTAAGTTSVIILGGTTAVPATVVAQLAARNITVVTRLGGADRSETSRLIADYLINSQAFTNTTFNVASGDPRGAGADALSGAALSGKQNRALLITNTPNSAAPVIAFATARAATLNAAGTIFGGPVAVSTALEAAIEAAGAANAGPVALTAATVAQGGNLTGTITGDFSSVTVSGCGLTNQTIGADDNSTTAGRQFTLNVSGGQAAGNCTLSFTATPTGGGAAVTQTIQVAVTAGAGSATTRPELRSAAIVSTTTRGQANATTPEGTVVSYTFDEPVLSANPASFQLVRSDGTPASGATLVSVSGSTVTVRFAAVNATVDTTGGGSLANVSNYTLATNSVDAATDAQGQTAPEGDAAVGTAASTTTTAVANTTTAPDLRSVAGFRQANPAVATNTTAVDFTFDQAAFLTTTGATAGAFNLVLLNGDVLPCTGPAAGSATAGGGTITGGNGTTTITVLCANPNVGSPAAPRATSITAAEVARVFVTEGTVAASQANASATPIVNDNPLQSVNLTNSGLTTTADLVSAQFLGRNTAGNATDNDQVVYTFDQSTAGTLTSEFRVFFANGDSAAGTVNSRSSDSTRVLVNFTGSQLTDAVGASVTSQDAGATSIAIRPASVGVAPVRPGTSARTPGQVDAPELRSVAISTTTNALGVVTSTATYTFDQAINPASVGATSFVLYNANGNRLVGSTCAVPTDATSTNTRVVCSAFTGSVVGSSTLQETVAAATLGTVLPGAVTGAVGSSNVNSNPAGAESTTGGTGTRAS